jgi:NAD(P) transhydrogenase subunit alpha
MRVGIPRETWPGETRVAVIPAGVAVLKKAGLDVAVESGAGVAAGFTDDAYRQQGAAILTGADIFEGADILLAVRAIPPGGTLHAGQAVIGFADPLGAPDAIHQVAASGAALLSMELMPRITRAQSMDALSSMATIAGYKGVLLAANAAPRMFPMLMTAAGTISSAHVFIVGAGVAGLQAIATARRLGAVVSGFDVRPVVREQVESLGAAFLDLGVSGTETEGGYATELTPEQQAQQQAALEERIPEFDVVITTALVPGRPAPKLIPAAAVAGMRPGSVIVDLAAETGGNCELTAPGEEVEREGVTIVGFTDLASRLPYHASQLYSRNVSALLEHLAPGGELALDFDDEITGGACVTRERQPA